MDQNGVRKFWEEQAQSALDSNGLRPTARDECLQSLIETAITNNLKLTDRLLDIGCGDGLSTLAFALHVNSAVGTDYIPAFVERATENAKTNGIFNAKFVQADVLNLGPIVERFGLFDVAVSIRCLINVFPAENQAKAIAQIAQCVKPGGLYIYSEGSLDAMDALDAARSSAGLPVMDRTPHNLLMADAWMQRTLQPFFEPVKVYGLGLYLYLSRVVQPLLVAPERPSHKHPLNRVAAKQQLQRFANSPFSGMDYAGVHVLRRYG